MKKVVYNGNTLTYAPCSDPSNLIMGKVYNVVHEEVGAWQTNYTLEGVTGSYNSVWFNPVKPIYMASSSEYPKKGDTYRCFKMFSGEHKCMLTSHVQDVMLLGAYTYKVETLNSIYIVQVISN